jgi:hypothetical protein
MTKLEFDYKQGEDYSSAAIFPGDYLNFEGRPSFWKKLNYYLMDTKSKDSIIRYMLYECSGSPKTIKACPAMSCYFNRSIPIKFTTDVFLETFDDGRFNYRYYDKSLVVHEHSPFQVGGHLRDNFTIVKFAFNIVFRLPSNGFNLSTPILYNYMPYEVMPGMIENAKHPMDLNVNALFPKINCKYHFKAGDICAVMQLDKPITKIEHNKNLFNEWNRAGYLKYTSPITSTKPVL